MRILDFRSDTVTQPTDEMRKAMAEAVVGDDILGEDPTVDELESYSARLLGKEAGLFVTSGTMANQIAISALTERGDEIIVGEETHIFNLEVGGLAAVSQVQTYPLRSDRGYFDEKDLRRAIRRPGIQAPISRLLCLENTYNLNSGIPLPADYLWSVSNLAREHGLGVYMDGARIFNAAVALDVDVKELAAPVDALMFCLTKGLAAPFGAVLVGSHELIEKSRWIRQRLGGGMRQAGHMAAAGLVGVKTMRKRLLEDHVNAKRLAEGLAAIDASIVDPAQVLTNVVHLEFAGVGQDAATMVERLAQKGLKIKNIGDTECRMIAHFGLDEADVDQAVALIAEAIRE